MLNIQRHKKEQKWNKENRGNERERKGREGMSAIITDFLNNFLVTIQYSSMFFNTVRTDLDTPHL